MRRFFLFLLFLFLFSFISDLYHLRSVFAQHFQSSSYIIDWGNFNVTSGKKSSTSYSLTDTVGQNAPGQYNSTGYVLKSGFQYIYDSVGKFSFQINDLSINFGTLVPNVGTTDFNYITITSPPGHGYEITASESHPLRRDAQHIVPDTTCDNGSCSESVSGVWMTNVGSTAYGFGFNAIGLDSNSSPVGIGTSNYFQNSTYYRQFANAAAQPAEVPQIIMSENKSTKIQTARVTYKTFISPQQTAGRYETSIIFTAIPKY